MRLHCIFMLDGACCHHQAPNSTCIKRDPRLSATNRKEANVGCRLCINIAPPAKLKKRNTLLGRQTQRVAEASHRTPADPFDALLKGLK